MEPYHVWIGFATVIAVVALTALIVASLSLARISSMYTTTQTNKQAVDDVRQQVSTLIEPQKVFTPTITTDSDAVSLTTEPPQAAFFLLGSSCRMAWVRASFHWKQADPCSEDMGFGHVVVDISKANFSTIHSFWGFVQGVGYNPYQYLVGDGYNNSTKTINFRLSRNGCSATDSCLIALLVIGT